jgi:hypothetical protein
MKRSLSVDDDISSDRLLIALFAYNSNLYSTIVMRSYFTRTFWFARIFKTSY